MIKLVGLTILAVTSTLFAADSNQEKIDRLNKTIETIIGDAVKTEAKKYPNFTEAPTVKFSTEVDKKWGSARTEITGDDKYSFGPEIKATFKKVNWDEDAKTNSTFDLKALATIDEKKSLVTTTLNGTITSKFLKVLNKHGAAAILYAPESVKKSAVALAKATTVPEARTALIELVKASLDDPSVKNSPGFKNLTAKTLKQFQEQEKTKAKDLTLDLDDIDFKKEFEELGLNGLSFPRIMFKLTEADFTFELGLGLAGPAVDTIQPGFKLFKDALVKFSAKGVTEEEKTQLKGYIVDVMGDLHDRVTVLPPKANPGKKGDEKKQPISLPFPLALFAEVLPTAYLAILPTEASMIRATE